MEERIYYLLDPVANEVKIGISCDIELRQRTLTNERGTELILLATHRGTVNDERQSHLACRVYRVAGEWFTDCHQLRKHIQNRVRCKLNDCLRQLQRFIESLEEHGPTESADWQDDMAAAIRDEMTEYLRLLEFCETGPLAAAA